MALVIVRQVSARRRAPDSTSISGVEVDVVRPPHLNRSQGSIWAPELAHHLTTDLLQGFASQGVTEVYRPRDPNVLILTFDTKQVPDEVTAAFLRCPVRMVVSLHALHGSMQNVTRCVVFFFLTFSNIYLAPLVADNATVLYVIYNLCAGDDSLSRRVCINTSN